MTSRMDTDKILYRQQSESIIGAAMQVLNTLKPGLNEKAYENALVIELRKRGHAIEQQRRFDVLYDGQWVDTLVPDLLVDGLIVVDPKVVTAFDDTHLAQMMGYLAITHFRLALLIAGNVSSANSSPLSPSVQFVKSVVKSFFSDALRLFVSSPFHERG
jgi:GxxExxY protein